MFDGESSSVCAGFIAYEALRNVTQSDSEGHEFPARLARVLGITENRLLTLFYLWVQDVFTRKFAIYLLVSVLILVAAAKATLPPDILAELSSMLQATSVDSVLGASTSSSPDDLLGQGSDGTCALCRLGFFYSSLQEHRVP